MIANHVHDALRQVRTLQNLITEKRRFRGYSGAARMAAGVCALTGAAIISLPIVPAQPAVHLFGWAAVLVLALAFNYSAVVGWFLRESRLGMDFYRLLPTIDALPPLAVGGILSCGLIRTGNHDLLFGVWMSLYGLAHLAHRQSLPRANCAVGLFYLLCGTACTLSPAITFTNPWPMGIVFFVGEMAGGIVLYQMNRH